MTILQVEFVGGPKDGDSGSVQFHPEDGPPLVLDVRYFPNGREAGSGDDAPPLARYHRQTGPSPSWPPLIDYHYQGGD